MQAVATLTAGGISDLAAKAKGKPRVLYAEDQLSSRIVTEAMLKRMGYLVDAVEDGELALTKAKEQRYDIILLDIEMPVMDGVTAARAIREEAHLCNDAPILAMSAFLADSTEHSEWRGAFDWALPKPATADELKRAMALAAQQHSARDCGGNDAGEDRREIAGALTGGSIVDGLREHLPFGIWNRLAANAAEEMLSLALTISACAEARDDELCRRAMFSLERLARNFGADPVVQAIAAADVAAPESSRRIVGSITDWKYSEAA